MDVTQPTELGAWFTWDHAWDTDADTVAYASLFLSVEFDKIPWPVEFVDGQPYETSKEMRAKVLAENVLRISVEGNGGPLGPHYNLVFRAVHDQHHVLIKAPFNFPGEARASAHMLSLVDHSAYVPAERRSAVKAFFFSEMMGQLSYYYTNGRQYLDEQYAVRYDDKVVAAFQAYWMGKQVEFDSKESKS